MIANTNWTAETYEYSGAIVEITYEIPQGPDLAANSVKLDKACYSPGDTVKIQYAYQNIGVSTNKSFTVQVRLDGMVHHTQVISGAAQGSTLTGQVDYKITNAVSKQITLVVDANNEVDAPGDRANNIAVQQLIPHTSCGGGGGGGGPEEVKADFTLEKTSISFGEDNGFQPQVTVTGGDSCALKEMHWTAVQGSLTHEWKVGQSYVISFSGPPYPGGMGQGTVAVTLKVTTTCGTVKTVPSKSFVITVDGPGNSPPVFQGAWFDGSNTNAFPPIYETTQGSMVDLGIVKDIHQTPKTPYDPEGDGIVYTWNFAGSSSAWIRQLKADRGFWDHDDHYGPFRADVLGTHTIQVSAVDTRGAVTEVKTVTLNVVPENPVPLITLPPKVIEGRPVSPPVSCERSYSPAKRKISTCDWTGRQSLYEKSGDYDITLSVTDSSGLKSLSPASAILPVLPDLPPVASLVGPVTGIRGKAMPFKNNSYSPDEDPTLHRRVTLACDSNNDGSYASEPGTSITMDDAGQFSLTPDRVGKCRLSVFIQEAPGYQKQDSKDFYFEVVNEAPYADFYLEGSNFSPAELKPMAFPAQELLGGGGGSWKASSLHQPSRTAQYVYNAQEDALESYQNDRNIGGYKGITASNVRTEKRAWSCTHNDPGCGVPGESDLMTSTLAKISSDQNYGYLALDYPLPRKDSYWPSLPNTFSYPDMVVNAEEDRVWFRDVYYYQNNNRNYYDAVYRVSDLYRDARAGKGSAVTAAPVYSLTTFVQYKSGVGAPPPPPPPPEFFPMPPVKGKLSDVHTSQITFTGSYNQYGTDYAKDGWWFSKYNTDRSGARFSYRCIQQTCSLNKVLPDGSTQWSYSYWVPLDYYNNPDYQRTIRPIEYISEDNSKLILGSVFLNGVTLPMVVIDNRTGAELFSWIDTGYRMVNEVVSYFHTEQLDGSTRGSVVSFYDLGTNQVLASHIVTRIPAGAYDYGQPMSTVSLDGKRTIGGYRRGDAGRIHLYTFDYRGKLLSTVDVQGPADYTEAVNSTTARMFYSGDGRLQLAFNIDYQDSDNEDNELITVITDTDAEADLNTPGHLYNSAGTIADGEISELIKFNYNAYTDSASAGLIARRVDHDSMYRLEVTPNKARVVKLKDGVKTVLREVDIYIPYRSYVEVRLKLNGPRLRGYVGGVPIIDAADNEFVSGSYGTYTEQAHVLLKSFGIIAYEATDVNLQNTAIVNTPLSYVKSYSDLEKDPGLDTLARWTFRHVEPDKFLDAGDGFSGRSAMDGQTVISPAATLDKVGRYQIEYQLPDDPAPEGFKYPNMAFDAYRKYSDPAAHLVTIHRRPVARFALTVREDHSIGWEDTSYDPDRWLSESYYSVEAAGLDYRATRGIVERKRNYTTPSGELKAGQLTRPGESGIYTVREAVKDEYGAWSDWYEVTLKVTIPVPNVPPGVQLVFPDGSREAPSQVGLRPVLSWNQSDADPGTIFSLFDLCVKDEWGTEVRCVQAQAMDTTLGAWSWTLDRDLISGRKYQVQVRISDGNDWSSWSNVGWMQTNRPPEAFMSYPYGTQDEPTMVNTLRPQFAWLQTDPDADTVFSGYQLEVTNEANDTMLLDSGRLQQSTKAAAGSWGANFDLPAGQKLRVRVKVWDQYGAQSDWSPQAWFIINRAPVGNLLFDTPIYEHDSPLFTVEGRDPDGDALRIQVEVSFGGAAYEVLQQWDAVMNGERRALTYGPLPEGAYRLRLTLNDGRGGEYVQQYAFEALPLELLGYVSHTPDWEAYRVRWNDRHAGDIRDPDVFWAGEAFVLDASVTDTGNSSTLAQGVEVTLLETGEKVSLGAFGRLSFHGELLNTQHVSLLRGMDRCTFRFEVKWSNGLVQQVDVPVRIRGSIYEVIVNQIRH